MSVPPSLHPTASHPAMADSLRLKAKTTPPDGYPGLPPLIPREVLFGNPVRTNPQLSPDGTRIAWVAPDDRNVLQVWVQTLGQDDTRKLTSDQKRGIRGYFWCEDLKTLVYLQDADGDENWHLYGMDVEQGTVRDLTPFPGVQAQPLDQDSHYPDTLLVNLNLRNPELHDVYRLTLSTGELELDTENPGTVMGFVPDAALQIRLAFNMLPDGGTELLVRDSSADPWRSWLQGGAEETLSVHGFTQDGQSVILSTSLGGDTTRLVEKNIQSGDERLIAHSPEVDIGGVMISPRTHAVQAVAFSPGRTRWEVVDSSIQPDFDGIQRLYDGDFVVVSRSRDDQHWLVNFTSDRGPTRFYQWDRASQTGQFLFVQEPRLESLVLGEMLPMQCTSRDGLTLHGYLTLPPGLKPEKLPLVLLVHGGPWVRDVWGYQAQVQWLANRGYACLQINYRSSTGYGKRFLGAGYKQWGKKMHDDLIDAVQWAVDQGVADPARVAIFGGSYGGYSALAGVTFTPDVFACSVAIVGPSNLTTFIRSIPAYWRAFRSLLDARVGNIDDPQELEDLKACSPLNHVHRIVKPLLIGQGANDPRVVANESQQIVEAIQQHKGSVTYVLYPDEGHGFYRPENRMDFNARAEFFLAQYLGGRVEDFPEHLTRVPGSSALVKRIQQGEVLEDTTVPGGHFEILSAS